MLFTDARFSEQVEAEVGQIEDRTDAEVVVVAARRSGSYADLSATGAAFAALAAFGALLLVPWQVSPAVGIVDLVFTYAVARWFLNADWFLRLVASDERKDRQTRLAAAAEFHLEAVHSTPQRQALLIYVSAMEGRVELIPDVGLEARIPRGRWVAAAGDFAHDDLEHFVSGLKKVGDLLAKELPRTEVDGRVDLDNRPRIRS